MSAAREIETAVRTNVCACVPLGEETRRRMLAAGNDHD